MEHGGGVKRVLQSSTVPTPRFTRGVATLPFSHTGGTYSHNGMMDYPRFPTSEVHLGKFPDSLEFQSWKVNFKTEVCSKSAVPHLTVDQRSRQQKSVDHPTTSRSMAGEMGSPRWVDNRRRRTREGPEPACVRAPARRSGTRGEGRANMTSCRGTV